MSAQRQNRINLNDQIKHAVAVMESGGVIAYPTEAVYGLGCDPLREEAVNRVLALKGRSRAQGLIVIAAEVSQVLSLIEAGNDDALARAQATWPGPVTWVFPARAHVPGWITGGRGTVAVRVTAHPVAAALCAAFGRGLVSTSANVGGEPPARSAGEAGRIFGDALSYIVPGEVGGLERPTPIRDALTGEVLRDG